MYGASEPLCEATDLYPESEASDSNDTAEQDTTISSGPSERPVAEEKPHMQFVPSSCNGSKSGHDRS